MASFLHGPTLISAGAGVVGWEKLSQSLRETFHAPKQEEKSLLDSPKPPAIIVLST